MILLLHEVHKTNAHWRDHIHTSTYFISETGKSC